LLARALATSPAVLILDETLASLDDESTAGINEQLFELQADAGFAVVLIGHDLAAARRCDRAVIVDNGTIAESGTAADVFDQPSSIAGRAFAAAARRLQAASC
jgi:ABC-type sulfate/molybdate transport systems ATPase subunit